MRQYHRCLRIALTGGISTGKTYTLKQFASLGVPTIDADQLSRQMVELGSPGWTAIRNRFGPTVFNVNGELERKKLASIIFNNLKAKQDLEAIIHPKVHNAIICWFADLDQAKNFQLGVADIPLLYESNRSKEFDRVIVVSCDPEIQVKRTITRDNISESEARQRIAAQLPIADKVSQADFIISTNGSKSETNQQIDELHQKLVRLNMDS